ncbi:MAG: hypothetical protein IPJ32_04005 [Sphingobacteriaceae bacterium]|nr:hypothetical protein [Sphingobacteriaceae bacterium]
MVHRSKLNDLVSFGISKEQLAKLKDKVVYNYDWGYINETDFVTSLKDEEIYFKIRERKLAAVRRKIESSYGWMKLIEEKS